MGNVRSKLVRNKARKSGRSRFYISGERISTTYCRNCSEFRTSSVTSLCPGISLGAIDSTSYYGNGVGLPSHTGTCKVTSRSPVRLPIYSESILSCDTSPRDIQEDLYDSIPATECCSDSGFATSAQLKIEPAVVPTADKSTGTTTSISRDGGEAYDKLYPAQGGTEDDRYGDGSADTSHEDNCHAKDDARKELRLTADSDRNPDGCEDQTFSQTRDGGEDSASHNTETLEMVTHSVTIYGQQTGENIGEHKPTPTDENTTQYVASGGRRTLTREPNEDEQELTKELEQISVSRDAGADTNKTTLLQTKTRLPLCKIQQHVSKTDVHIGEGPKLVLDSDEEPSDDLMSDESYEDPRLEYKGYACGDSEDTHATGKRCAPSRKPTRVPEVAPYNVDVARALCTSPASQVQSNWRLNVTHDIREVPVDYMYLTTQLGGTHLTVNVDSNGGNFTSDRLRLSGTVPPGAVEQGRPLSLQFVSMKPETYQRQMPSKLTIVSDVYHFLPHGTSFASSLMIRISHRGQMSRNPLKLVCSETGPSEDTNWTLVQPGRSNGSTQHLRYVVTKTDMFIWTKRFCLFAVVEEKQNTRFTDVSVFGRYYSLEHWIKITVVIGSTGDDQENKGVLLKKQPLLLYDEIEEVEVTFHGRAETWQLQLDFPSEQKLRTHYLMNDKPLAATYLLKPMVDCACLAFSIGLNHNQSQAIHIAESLYDLDPHVRDNARSIVSDPRFRGVDDSDTAVKYRDNEPPNRADKAQQEHHCTPFVPKSAAPDQLRPSHSVRKRDYGSPDEYASPPAYSQAVRSSANVQPLQQRKAYAHADVPSATNMYHNYGEVAHLSKPKLMFSTKDKLCQMMDPEVHGVANWRHLADELGFGAMLRSMPRKTFDLLMIWECTGVESGSPQQLAKILGNLGREDAAQVVYDDIKQARRI